jgi:dihydrofolate synthase/folylpolyglutamate synthase
MTETTAFASLEKQLQTMASPGIRPGLARLAKLLSLAGHPERKFPAVHIVGTNGKGSTAATLDSILRESGYSTALYTSPHLVSFGERLLFGGREASATEWLSYAAKVKELIENCPYLCSDRPTYFEIITAVAFMIIADRNVDVAVVEAGMGGRLDASNILKNILLSIIVPVGMDHMEYLGDTLVKIANEKFAVMRPGVPALFYGGEAETEQAFLDRAGQIGAPAHIFKKERRVALTGVSVSGTDFTLEGGEQAAVSYHTPLAGTFQADNAALAIRAAELLSARCGKISAASIRRGVAMVSWPGRFELLSSEPVLLIDGGHNPHAMKRVVETLTSFHLADRVHLVLAMMKDKDVKDSLLLLKQLEPLVYCTEVPAMQRCMKASDLRQLAESCGLETEGEWQEPMSAIKASVRGGAATLCCGSLYLVGYIKGHPDELPRF